jgi:hypothetical protein
MHPHLGHPDRSRQHVVSFVFQAVIAEYRSDLLYESQLPDPCLLREEQPEWSREH